MKLKRLEIQGFKSFADKCTIDFPPGISAVVGPNGCGKSNIIDAIKWVMGEQSIKQLRGKSMGDVIFSGTDKRAAVNLAEVSLVLSDHDENKAEAAGAYTEIMITRRLYRSGESLYMLNKQPCRLKDIHDIFLRHGMGSRSCAIIQQGNIGAITDASAEERRTFVEEAAGVMRYKSRKQEAMTKVNATRQNLLRLNDIIEEIEKQLASLSRQAKKAKRYKELRQRLKETDFQVSVYYHENYTRQIEKTQSLLEELQAKDAQSADALERLNAALQEIDEKKERKKSKIEEKKAARAEKQRHIDKLESELAHLNEESTRLTDEVARLENALADLNEKNRKIESEIAENNEKIEDLNTRIADINQDLDDEKQASENDKAELTRLNAELEQKQKHLMELSSRRAKYQNIYQNAEANKENLERRIQQNENDKAETEDQVAELSDSEAAIREKQDRVKQQLESLMRRKSECETQLKAKSDELGAQVKSVNALSNDRSKLKSKRNVLRKMDTNFEWYKDGVKAVMQHKGGNGSSAEDGGDSRSERIVGIMAEIIEPEPGYEHAVEAVLGEALQYILVTDQAAGAEYIHFLRTENAGRCGFIPVENGTNPAPDAGKTSESNAALENHVTICDGYAPMLNGLLSGIAVADDFDAALQLWHRRNGFQTIVTKDGDVISDKGIMVGGSKDKLAGILEKKQEIRQLESDLADIDDRLAAEKETQQRLESEVKELENTLSSLTEKKYKLDEEAMEAEKSLYKNAEQLKHARRQLEIATLEQKRLEGEKDDIKNEIAEHDSALSEVSKDIGAVEAEIETYNEQIATLNEQIKTFDNKQMDLKLDLTRLTAELENAQSTVGRLEKFKSDGHRQIEQTRHDIAAKKERLENIGRQQEASQGQLAGYTEALQAVKAALKDEQTDYQAIVEQRENTDASASETQSELEQTREKLHKLELELSGLQINRENIVNRFLERYAETFSAVRTAWRETVTAADFSIEKTENERAGLQKKIEQIGEVNIGAIDAYEEQKTRHDFLIQQRQDLEEALADLENVIQKINRITRDLFSETFNAINEKFQDLFPQLFNGGAAWLELTQPDAPLETGVELMIHPPGKKVSRLSLLSGGEKALSAIAFIFSIFLLNPAAFCLLDEIDAPLDDVNVHRFNELLKIIGEKTQIIMISHNKKTMEFSEMLFGITMGQGGVSKLISVNIDQAVEMNTENKRN
ncbi:MAG: chromosome segregation protein SMC [Thermodesulfobacteriota bacterium]